MKTSKLDSMGNERLPLFTRLLMGTSGGMWTLNFMMIQTYLLFIYTDVFKISAAYVAMLFLFTRIVDAILAPATGIFVDRTMTPWGKYKPYFIILGVPFAISGFFTFTDPTLLFGSISETGMYVYASVTYIIFSTLYSVCGAASGGVGNLMTKSIDDRVSMGQINAFAAMIAGILVTAGATPFVIAIGGSTNSAKGWMIIMGIISIITIIYNVTGAFVYKEKYLVVENVKKEKLTSKQMVTVIFKNRTALVGLAILLGVNLSGGIRSGVMLYYFQYYFNMPALMTIIGLVGLIATLAGTIFSGILCRKIGIKKTIELSVVVSIITGAITFFAPANQTGVIYYVVISIIGSFFSGLYMPVYGTLMPAAIDYAEWKFNVVANGYIGSFTGFVQTLATAISGALAAAALAFIGYQPGPIQTGNTIMGLRILVSVIPAVLQIFMMAIVWYDLTEDKQKIITTELRERREKAEAALNNAPAQ